MPELPEVETIVNDLREYLPGKEIAGVKVTAEKSVMPSPQKFRRLVKGRKIKQVDRRGKNIIIRLDQDNLLIHLKMTGQLVYQDSRKTAVGGHPIQNAGADLPNKFTRVELDLSGQATLCFNDVRKFGWVKLLDEKELDGYLQRLGLEPLSQEFDWQKLKQALARKKDSSIKQALLDQQKIVGVGNIYADEALFAAGVRPSRKVKAITNAEWRKITEALVKVLKKSIRHRGTSFSDYRDAVGKPGGFVPYLRVYGRAGQECKVCGNDIKKIKLGGRGTHYCSVCQN